jgi:hypothetical protein
VLVSTNVTFCKPASAARAASAIDRACVTLYGHDLIRCWDYWPLNRAHLLKSNPNSWVNDVLGHAFLKLGEMDEAMLHFQAPATINPNDADSNVNFANSTKRRKVKRFPLAVHRRAVSACGSLRKSDGISDRQGFCS